MMTPQEVANCTFAKAVMGGYNMAAVDDFLDKLTEDYTNLYKENAALKAKIKVLVDKMEEYRQIEDAMRSTLLAAQKTASGIVAEAEAKRDAIIADAAGGAKERLAEIKNELEQEEQRLITAHETVNARIEEENKRLAMAQESLRTFMDTVGSVCRQQLELLEKLPELPVAPVAPVETAAPAAEEVPAQAEEETDKPDQAVMDELADVFASVDKENAPVEDLADVFAEDSEPVDMTSTRKITLDDLQFGKNYIKD